MSNVISCVIFRVGEYSCVVSVDSQGFVDQATGANSKLGSFRVPPG